MSVRQYDHEGRLIGEEQTTVGPQPGCEESLDSLLRRTEAELRSHYPMMIDSGTRLDAVTAGKDSLQYHYTLVDAALEDLDVEATKAALTPLVRQQTQSMRFLKLLMQKGATISFHYHDQDGKEIAVIDVTRESAAE